MAVMNGTNLPPSMHGGIDQQITDRIGRANGNPQALMQKYGSSKNILDLIAMQRAVSLVAEQRKNEDLQKVGNPYTIADQLGEQVVADQKELMMGPLQKLRGKTEDVGGVLGNQQMQGAPTMAAAQGGIINAPAPNLTRMYNGGIVGYAEGGLTRDEADAYLKKVDVKQEEFDNATPEVQARIIAEINKKIAEDRDLGTVRSKGSLNVFGGTTKSDAQMEDRNRGLGEFFTAPFRSDPTGIAQFEKEPEIRDPNKAQKAAERLMNLPNATIEGFRIPPTDAPADPTPTDAPADPKPKPEGIETALPNPYRVTDGKYQPATVSDERIMPRGAFEEQLAATPGIKEFNQKVASNREQDQEDAFQAAEAAEAAKSQTPVALLKKQLAGLDGKKGIAGLVERFANTDFQKSYGGTGEALAQAGRDIAKTGKDEKAAKRKFLEGQLGVQQGIEAKGIEAAESTRQYEATLGQRVAEQEESAEQWRETFAASNAEFIKTFDQSAEHKETLEGIKNTDLEIQRLLAANTGRSLDAQTQETKTQTLLQANDLIRKLQTDTDKLIQEEVSAIENSSTIDVEDKPARAKEWRAKREAGRDASIASVRRALGINGGGGSGSGAFSNFEKE